MLYLNPPYHQILGVCCFPDHADPRQFYYLPLGPRVSRFEGPGGQRIPRLQVIEYRGTAGTGGFLNFDVDLGIDEAVLEEVRSELKRLQDLRDPPRLAPVPLEDGTVKVMLFGKQTGDAPAADDDRAQFVIKIDQHAKPALYGDNRAAFSVALDKEGVVVLKKALEGELAPLGIVYSLDFLALRPAYAIRLSVDWNRVQKHFEESFGANLLIFSTEITKAIDELEEQRVIVIEADTFVPEGEDTAGIIGRRDLAMAQVREMITDAFFQPSLDPVADKEDGWDKAQDMLWSLTNAGLGGADGLFSYKKVDYTRIDKKSLNVSISERTTVKRSIYPQGHLSGLARMLRNEGLDPSGFLISVDLDDPWFERRKVEFVSVANHAEDSLHSISVTAEYAGTPKTFLLEAGKDRATLEWPSIVQGGVMQKEVSWRFGLTFTGVDSSERPVSLESARLQSDQDVITVVPRTLYSVVSIPIAAPSFDAKIEGTESTLWDRYPQVEVRTRYADERNRLRLDENVLLDKTTSSHTWKLFLLDPARTQFAYKLIYHAADHKDVEQPWVETSEERILVLDPRPIKRTLTIFPQVDWSLVERVFVDVSYEDAFNGVRKEQSFEWSTAASQTFRVDLVDPTRRVVAYQVTLLFKNGTMSEVPRSLTREPRLIVRADMKGHRIVDVRSQDVPFADRGLKEMAVELSFEDAAGSRFQERVVLRSEKEGGSFEYDFSNAQQTAYWHRTTYLYLNGLSRTIDWASAAGATLVVPVE